VFDHGGTQIDSSGETGGSGDFSDWNGCSTDAAADVENLVTGPNVEFLIGVIAGCLYGFVVVEKFEEVDEKRGRSVGLRKVCYFGHGDRLREEFARDIITRKNGAQFFLPIVAVGLEQGGHFGVYSGPIRSGQVSFD
jgi:hypothetical protein